MRQVAFIVYPGFQLLDLAGVASVFSGVEVGGARPYRVGCSSLAGGSVPSGSGIAVETSPVGEASFGADHTVVVPGAEDEALRRAMADAELVGVVAHVAKTAERVAGVSTGAFLLGKAGVLDGRKAVTYWARKAEFTAQFPGVTLLGDEIFAEDGGRWTSAGTTTGIDMALDMVKRDHGNAPAHDVARALRGRRARARLREHG